MSTSEKRFQFYGRRKGKSLRRHHSALMDQLLPHVRVALDDPLAGLGDRRWLEIGGGAASLARSCGSSATSLDQCPEQDYI